jgi:hypothetical protein
MPSEWYDTSLLTRLVKWIEVISIR